MATFMPLPELLDSQIDPIYTTMILQEFYVGKLNPETGRWKIGEKIQLKNNEIYGRIFWLGQEQMESLYTQLQDVLEKDK